MCSFWSDQQNGKDNIYQGKEHQKAWESFNGEEEQKGTDRKGIYRNMTN